MTARQARAGKPIRPHRRGGAGPQECGADLGPVGGACPTAPATRPRRPRPGQQGVTAGSAMCVAPRPAASGPEGSGCAFVHWMRVSSTACAPHRARLAMWRTTASVTSWEEGDGSPTNVHVCVHGGGADRGRNGVAFAMGLLSYLVDGQFGAGRQQFAGGIEQLQDRLVDERRSPIATAPYAGSRGLSLPSGLTDCRWSSDQRRGNGWHRWQPHGATRSRERARAGRHACIGPLKWT